MNGAHLTILGVGPAGFAGEWLESTTDLWVPATLQSELQYRNNYSSQGSADDTKPWVPQDNLQWLRVIGRASPASRGQAVAALGLAYQQGMTSTAITTAACSRRRIDRGRTSGFASKRTM